MPRILPSVFALTALTALAALVSGCSSEANATGGTGGTGGADIDSGPATGCAADTTATPFTVGMHASSASGDVTVAITATPPVPGPSDDSTWKLKVTDKSGAPVPSGTTVSVLCKMAHMAGGHGCASVIQVTELSEGVYEAKHVVFNMAGHWVVAFQVNGTDEVSFQLCVE